MSKYFLRAFLFYSGTPSLNWRICGTKIPTVYTAEKGYVYLYLNRPRNNTGCRGVMVGYIAYGGNDCTSGTHNCSSNAYCTNTRGSYRCTCKSGYTGNGFRCSRIDVNECTLGTHKCGKYATCTNTIGSYKCTCKSGYTKERDRCVASDNGLVFIGALFGTLLGLITFIAVIKLAARFCPLKTTSTTRQANLPLAATSATFGAANASANDTFTQNAEPWQQNMPQPAVIFNEESSCHASTESVLLPSYAASTATDANAVPPPEYQAAIATSINYPMAPPPYSSSIASSSFPLP
ncbi:uncharacterized protein LOC135683531 [Rhopilema esculentum]|uniref:uncharacterized protein LOC135683531 n=1 Tax=Rhopilema esculentum TaxID=499914 RepID=UPI0031D38470